MKFYNKLSGLVLAAAIVVGTTSTAFAATNNEVLEALKNAGVSSTQLATAENYLKSNQIDAAALDTVKTKIDAVTTLANSKGITDVTKLSAEDKATVVSNIQAAATAIGLNATVSTVDGKGVISLTDTNGKVVASFGSNVNGSAMKTTGTNNGNLIVFGSAMVALAVAGLAFRKKVTN